MFSRLVWRRLSHGPTYIRDWLRYAQLCLVLGMTLVLAWRLIPRLVLFGTFTRTSLVYPWTIDYDEGVNFASAYLLSQGHNPYDADLSGFLATPYPPLFVAFGAIWIRLGDLSLFGGRFLSLFATLVIASAAAWLVARESTSRVAGIGAGVLAGGFFLALSPTIIWAAFYKQDLPAVAFGLVGICWVARWPTGRRVYGALPWFMLAVYTKQTALTAPLAATLYLLWRDWRTGLRFACIAATLFAIPALVLQGVTRGGFWRHIVGFHSFPWQEQRFLSNIQHLVRIHRLLLGVAGAGLLALLVRRQVTPLGIYAVVSFASLMGNGTVGANYNHLLEALLGACLLAGALGAWLADQWQRTPQALGLAVICALLAAQVPTLGRIDQWFPRSALPTPQRAERLTRINRMIARAEGEVFCEDNHLLIRAGKLPRYYDLSTMGPLVAAGRWEEDAFVRDLRERRFALVVLYRDVSPVDHYSTSWSPAARTALRESYEMLYRDAMFTFAPRR